MNVFDVFFFSIKEGILKKERNCRKVFLMFLSKRNTSDKNGFMRLPWGSASDNIKPIEIFCIFADYSYRKYCML